MAGKSAKKTTSKKQTKSKRTTEKLADAQKSKDPSFQTVKIERNKGITFLIMNRPEKRNAMSPQLHMDMNHRRMAE